MRDYSHASSISILEAGLPKRLMQFRVAESKNAQWSKLFERLSGMTSTGFVCGFVGATGTGKSQMAVSLGKYVMHNGGTCLLVEAGDLCESIKDTFGTAETSRSVVHRYMRPSLLIIDEVNSGMSEFDVKTIQRIISRRYDTKRQDTILITNESAQGFCGLIGDRVVSRINDTGGVCDFNWKSFRN